MGHIISVANHRDGVGKTTAAVNLAASLAVLEKKTLLIDCDPHAHATAHMGLCEADISHHLFQVFMGTKPAQQVIAGTDLPYMDFIPATIDLSLAEQRLAIKPGKERVLHTLCHQLLDQYEVIIIDPPSSLGFFTMSALTAADHVIIPTPCEVTIREDIGQLLEVVQIVQEQLNPNVRIGGILFNMCRDFSQVNARLSPDILDDMTPIVFPCTIPEDAVFQDAREKGKPAVLYDIMSNASRSYFDLSAALFQKLLGS